MFLEMRAALNGMWICRYCAQYAHWHIEVAGERIDVCGKHAVEMAEEIGGKLQVLACKLGLIGERENTELSMVVESLRSSLVLLKRYDLRLPPSCYREVDVSLLALFQLLQQQFQERGQQWYQQLEPIRSAVVAARLHDDLAQRVWICSHLAALINQVERLA